MVLRARLVGIVGTGRLRSLHVSVSVLAALFIALHVYELFLPPISLPVDLGYAAVIIGLTLWFTGVGFLERNRDSFFLHGALALSLVSLVTVHAAASGTNVPLSAALVTLTVAAGLAFINAAYHAKKLITSRG